MKKIIKVCLFGNTKEGRSDRFIFEIFVKYVGILDLNMI